MPVDEVLPRQLMHKQRLMLSGCQTRVTPATWRPASPPEAPIELTNFSAVAARPPRVADTCAQGAVAVVPTADTLTQVCLTRSTAPIFRTDAGATHARAVPLNTRDSVTDAPLAAAASKVSLADTRPRLFLTVAVAAADTAIKARAAVVWGVARGSGGRAQSHRL